MLCSISANAKTGDGIGGIYGTDILCFINGVEVPSFNIGGKIVIVVEDTTNNYWYNNELRTLIIGGFEPADIIMNVNQIKVSVVY